VKHVAAEPRRTNRLAGSALVPLCLAAIPGLLIAPWLGFPAHIACAGAAATVLPATVLVFRSRREGSACDLLLVGMAAALGLGWGSLRPPALPLPAGIPEVLVSGHARASHNGIDVRQVRFQHEGAWIDLPGRFVWGSRQKVAGEFLARGYLVAFQKPPLPGMEDRNRRLRWEGLRGRIIPKRLWVIEASEHSTVSKGRFSVCRWLRGRIGWSLPAPVARLLPRVLWGERSELDAEMTRLFRATGTMHLLAISGLHVTLFAFLFDSVLRLLVRHGLIRLLFLLAILAGYAVLVGPRPSVIRSTIMAASLLSGRALGRPGSTGTAWWIALLAVVCFAPGQLASPGGQLSFVATASLILRPRLPRGLDLVGASATATAATSGILWAHFGAVAPLAVGANLVAIPALGPVLVSSIWGLAWGNPTNATLQAIAWGPTRLFADGLLGPLRLLAGIGEGTTIHCSCGELAGVAGSLAFLGVLAFARRLRPSVPAQILAAAACCLPLLIASIPSWIAASRVGDLSVTVLSIGQGDATLLRTNTGHAYLIDTGPGGSDRSRGRRLLAPALRALGVRRLRGCFLTHGDEDHIGGLRGMLQAGVRIDTLYLSMGDETHLELPRDRVPPVRILTFPWERTDGSLSMRLLAPRVDTQQNLGNEGSLVFRIEAPGAAMILPGDLGMEGEKLLLASGELEPAPVLLAGHHGSGGSTGDAWCDQIQPRLAVVSCGVRNRHGHPAPSVLERLDARGVEVHRTDTDGSLYLRWTGGRLLFRTTRGGCESWKPVL
jgi:competence protein ComEC